MDVAILGASGDCGRAIAGQLIAARLLLTTERLQLVGRRGGASASVLHGLVSDLTDAYAEHVPYLDVALNPEEIVADLWVVSAGGTIPPNISQARTASRSDLAAVNARVFRSYAEALARYGQGTEIVIVVSNPVELGVAYFAEAIGRDRVIGIGAYSDTLRFRREIAAALGRAAAAGGRLHARRTRRRAGAGLEQRANSRHGRRRTGANRRPSAARHHRGGFRRNLRARTPGGHGSAARRGESPRRLPGWTR